MSYEQFAYLYDELMKDAPYDQWVSFVKSILVQHEVEAARLLDLACGTGELSVRFAKQGFRLQGLIYQKICCQLPRQRQSQSG